jgi:polyisoprenyl-phosphate glycosyltransferase
MNDPAAARRGGDGPGATRPRVSVVTPVFNEEGSVPIFYDRLRRATDPLAGDYEFEFIFTNNRSTDRTLERILELRARDPRVQVLTYSRNFGQVASVLGGMKQASGDLIVLIDVDCEDPPEMIPEFLAGWREGNDIVYGERARRPEPAPITWARKFFYRFTRLTADHDIILDMAEFCLVTAAVRDAVVSTRSVQPFVRGEIAYYGFARKGIRYARQTRVHGRTHYNLPRMAEFALQGVLSTTTLPLRLPVFTLPVLVLVNLALAVAHFGGWWAEAFHAAMWIDAIWLAIAVSFIGLYLGRDYRNRVARPLVVVDWPRSAINTPPEHSPNALPRSGPRRDPA